MYFCHRHIEVRHIKIDFSLVLADTTSYLLSSKTLALFSFSQPIEAGKKGTIIYASLFQVIL